MRERADRRQEAALGIFRVDARLDRVAAERYLVLLLRQRLARGNAKLPFDEVLARDHFGDRVLDLQPRVHLHEIERAVARERIGGDELDRAGAHVADRLCARDRGTSHRAAMLRSHERRRRLLQHFLVSSLHRAIALEQVDRVAVRIGEHLDLDVARRRQVFLDQHAVVAEAGFRFALGGSERRGEIGGPLDDLHSLAAAAGGRLDQHGIADRLRFAREHLRVLVVAVIARHERDGGLAHDVLRRRLRAHRRDRCGGRSDEDDPRARAIARRIPRFPRESRSPGESPARRVSRAIAMILPPSR